MKIKIVIAALFIVLLVPGLYAQITSAIPGADDNGSSPACGASGIVVAGVGNPPPAWQLSKPCPTAQPAFAFLDLNTPLENGSTPVSALTSASFDVQDNTHCGAGAPRLVIDLNNHTRFVNSLGCNSGGTLTDLGNGWHRVSFNTAQIQAGVLAAGGSPADIITDIFILQDEGNDTPLNPPFIGTPGRAVIDNPTINGVGVIAQADAPTLSGWALAILAGTLAMFALMRMKF